MGWLKRLGDFIVSLPSKVYEYFTEPKREPRQEPKREPRQEPKREPRQEPKREPIFEPPDELPEELDVLRRLDVSIGDIHPGARIFKPEDDRLEGAIIDMIKPGNTIGHDSKQDAIEYAKEIMRGETEDRFQNLAIVRIELYKIDGEWVTTEYYNPNWYRG
jgi:hypothetical protein